MGHQRLGEIPKTQKWKAVVAKIAGSGGGSGGPGGGVALINDTDSVASEVLDAADQGLTKAIDDTGLRYTFYALTQLVLAARQQDWQREFADLGIHLSPTSGVFDLTTEFQASIDDYLRKNGRTSDISEMAQQAAGEAVSSLVGPKSKTLFGSGPDELQSALRELSTKKGFSQLGEKFFGKFIYHFLNSYISRIAPTQVGTRRLENTGALEEFNRSLETHCQQSARIVHDFCGEWYSKTEFQKGISLSNTSGFMAIAIKKLRSEFHKQREDQ